jgi:ABC-type nitrate/sulfonate/bicarbonate transport system substrate-binding protein
MKTPRAAGFSRASSRSRAPSRSLAFVASPVSLASFRTFASFASLGRAGLAAAVLFLAACAPATPPAAKPTEPAAKPAESKPAAAPTEAPKPAAAPAAPSPAAPSAAAPSQTAPSPATVASPAASPAAAGPSGPVKQVNVAISVNLSSTVAYAAIEKGIWVKHGLDPKLRSFGTGAEVLKAMTTGEIDLGVQTLLQIITAASQGLNVVMIGTAIGDPTRMYPDDNFTLIGGPKVKTIQDLPGKKLGMVNQGVSPVYLRAIAAKNNINYDQIEVINVPQTEHTRVLQTGQVDAIVTIEPFGVIALDQPGTTLLQRGGGFVSTTNMMLGRPEIVQNDPDTAQRFVEAYSEAAQWVRLNRNEAADIASHWLTGIEPAVARKGIPFISYDTRISKLTMQEANESMKSLIDAKTIKDPVDLTKYLDLRFINNTLAAHPEYFSDVKPTELLR